ncbi:MAG: COQ9 family protein [Alphaproteobacteria bacterium]
MTEPTDFTAIRLAILKAALPHIAFDGWSSVALSRGAADAGYDDVMAGRAFPNGARDLLRCHFDDVDSRMLAVLAQTDLAAMRVRDRITFAVRLRLEQNLGSREAIRRATIYLAQPQHSAMALRALYRTVDAIWYAAGDTATDFNFYSKRGLLAGVYSATVLFWLTDKSPDCSATWAFLDRRIADIMRVPKIKARMRAATANLPDLSRLFRLAFPKP